MSINKREESIKKITKCMMEFTGDHIEIGKYITKTNSNLKIINGSYLEKYMDLFEEFYQLNKYIESLKELRKAQYHTNLEFIAKKYCDLVPEILSLKNEFENFSNFIDNYANTELIESNQPIEHSLL